MFEAERMLLAETPFIPLYTYVTKRMVNPRLKGWESNVMDHHYSKSMFFLKAEGETPPASPEPGEDASNPEEMDVPVSDDEGESRGAAQ